MYSNGYPYPGYYNQPPAHKISKKLIIIFAIGIVIFTVLAILLVVFANQSGDNPTAKTEEEYVPEEDTDDTWKDDVLNSHLKKLIGDAKHADYKTTNKESNLSKTENYHALWNIASTGMLTGDYITEKFDKIWELKVMNANIINYYLDHGYLVVISGTGAFPFGEKGNAIVIYGAAYEVRDYYAFAYDSVGGSKDVYETILPSYDLFAALQDDEKFYIIKAVND
jgi:hypothetical protein